MASGSLGAPLLSEREFPGTTNNAILKGSDAQLRTFARRHLGYSGTKGLDIVARFNRKFVVAEAKFLTEFGGHQNAQFEDAKALLNDSSIQAIKAAILDGVLYIPSNEKMHRFLVENKEQHNIMSALVLREFLYQV